MLAAKDRSLKRLCIVGAGGHGRELAWLAQEAVASSTEIIFLVDSAKYLRGPVNGIPVSLVEDEELGEDTGYIIAVGDPALRRSIATRMEDCDAWPVTLIHPRAEIFQSTSVGEGVVVCAGTVITDNVQLGRHTHINIGCTISHDVIVEEFVTLSPGVHIAGNVLVQSGVFIGIGANIINGLEGSPLVIGEGATIAAGACVIGDVPVGAMMAGVPAVRKR